MVGGLLTLIPTYSPVSCQREGPYSILTELLAHEDCWEADTRLTISTFLILHVFSVTFSCLSLHPLSLVTMEATEIE